jgi:hypothetical protein
MDTEQHEIGTKAQGMAASFPGLTSPQTAREFNQVVVQHHGASLQHDVQSLYHTTLLRPSPNLLNRGQKSSQAAPVARKFRPNNFVHGRDTNGVRQLAFGDVDDANDWLHITLPPTYAQ